MGNEAWPYSLTSVQTVRPPEYFHIIFNLHWQVEIRVKLVRSVHISPQKSGSHHLSRTSDAN